MGKDLKRWVFSFPSGNWKEGKAVPGSRPSKGGPGLRLGSRRFQRWKGFGVCFTELGWAELRRLGREKGNGILRQLFLPGGECDFNFCRLPIGANDYAEKWYSHNESPGDYAMRRFSIGRDRKILIPYIKEALKLRPDMILFASPWSPPTWMKTPTRYNGGVFRWEKRNLKAYALYFRKFVEAYRKEGIEIRQVHVQNEPDSNQVFPSCLWKGIHLRDFIRDYLGPEFKRHKVPCDIWLGTLERGEYDHWARVVLEDAKARSFIRGVGYQWSGKGAIQRTHEDWPALSLMQTENECGDGKNTWAYAEYVFGLLHHYLSNGVEAYVYWNPILKPEGESTWGWKQNSLITVNPKTRKVSYNPEYQLMRHFSHFIHPGAVRREVSGPWADRAVAFENPDGETVWVVHNPASGSKTLSLPLAGKKAGFSLKGRSFNTFVF